MTNPNPYHVRLAISQYGDQFRAELFTEDLGDTEGKELLPSINKLPVGNVPDGDTTTFAQWLEALAGGQIPFHAEELRNIGRVLFTYLLGSAENLEKWQAICTQAEKQGRAIRLLIDATSDAVYDLPYGLLCAQNGTFLFQPDQARLAIQFVRILRQSTPRVLQLARQPLRMLVVAAEPHGLEVGCATYLCQFLHGLGDAYAVTLCDVDGAYPLPEVVTGPPDTWQSAQFTRFCRTTRDVLKRTLQGGAYDLLHVIAHGVGTGLLVCTATGARDEVTSGDFGKWVSRSHLQLAFLQVCKSGQAGDRGAFGGIAQKLVSPQFGNLAAVVASPYPIDPAQSTQVAIQFYQRLVRAESQSPDVALLQSFPEDEGDWRLWALLELWVRPRALESTGTRGFFQFPSPYRGLSRFEERDADIFFGRDAETRDVLKILADQTEPAVVAMVGDSGSGKSSLLQAGVCARVRRNGLLNRADWRITSLTPGATPAQNLMLALGVPTPDHPDEAALRQAFAQVRQAAQPLLLVFDQFEELFTLCADPAERQAVSTVLAETVQQHPDQFRLILGMRSEYLGAAAALPGLNTLITRPWVLKFPDASNVRAIVEQPAHYHGYTFAAGLLEKILTDPLLTTGAAPLPLLEFALERLWLKAVERGSQEFTHGDYEALGRLADGSPGGLGGAIARHADEVYDYLPNRPELGPTAQHVAEQILTGLVTTTTSTGQVKHTRRPRPRRELEAETGMPEVAHNVIDRLVGERLLTLRRNPNMPDDALVDLSHEVLLTRWEKLQQWLALDPEGRAMKEAFQKDLDRWTQGLPDTPAKSPQLLPNADVVATDYLAWIDSKKPTLTPAQKDFTDELRNLLRRKAEVEEEQRRKQEEQRQQKLEAAQKLAAAEAQARQEAEQRVAEQKKSNQRLRRRAIGLFVIFCIAVAAALYAGKKTWETSDANYEAKSNAWIATQKGVVAEKKRNAAEQAEKATKRQLHLNYLNNGKNARDIDKDWLKASHFYMNVAVSADDLGLARNAHLFSNKLINGMQLTMLLSHKNPVTGAAFSRDESCILTWEGSTARVWDSGTGQLLIPPLEHNGEIMGARFFSREEGRILTWGWRTVQVWDRRTGQPLISPLEYKNDIKGVYLSHDGARILIWSGDDYGNSAQEAQVWDITTGQPLTPPMEHPGTIMGAAFNHDETRVLSWGGLDVLMWDSKMGQLLAPQFEDMIITDGAAFSRDDARILTWGKRVARVWDSATGQPITPIMDIEYHGDIIGASFNQDGTRILTWGEKPPWGNKSTALVWDSVTGQPLTQLIEHNDDINGAVFSQDGSRILTWSADGTARIWDSEAGEPLTPPLQHQYNVTGAIFSRDDSRILTGSYDNTARLWDTATGQPLTPPLPHNEDVNGAIFSHDESRILTWSADGTVRVWNVPSTTNQGARIGQPLTPPMEHNGSIWGAVFSHDESRILTWSADSTARVWDSTTGQIVIPPLEHGDWMQGAVFSQNDSRILTWSHDGTAQVWDSATGRPIIPVLKHQGWVNGVVFSQDELRILTWSQDSTAQVWDSATGQPAAPPLEHDGPVKGAVFSRDESRILTWSDDNTARVWNSATGQPITSPLEHQDYLKGAIFSPDESCILTWGGYAARMWDSVTGRIITSLIQQKESDFFESAVFNRNATRILTRSGYAAQLWDSATGQPITSRLEHQDFLKGAIFNSDESRILTWSYDGTAQVWDSITGQPRIQPLIHQGGRVGEIWGAVFSRDESRILTWSADNTARLWNSATSQPLIPPLKHNSTVVGAIFNQDESQILTWSQDETARVWDSATGQPLTPPLEHKGDVNGAVFSRDETRILTWSDSPFMQQDGGIARVWEFQTDNDFPREHLILQLQVQTGSRMNNVGDIEFLSVADWQNQHDQYKAIASEHLKTCKFPRANLWLNRLLSQPNSCDHIGDWLMTTNSEVRTEVASMYAHVCLSRGNLWFQEQSYDRAIRAFETALQLQTSPLPNSQLSRMLLAETYTKLGRTLIESGQDIFKGIEYAQKSLKMQVYAIMGQATEALVAGYLKQGQLDEAANVIAKGLDAIPNNLDLLSSDIRLAFAQGDISRCQSRIDTVLTLLKPDNYLLAILPFYAYLTDPTQGWEPVLTVIEKMDLTKVTFKTWDFDETTNAFTRLDPKTQQAAQHFIAFFKGEIDLPTLKERLSK